MKILVLMTMYQRHTVTDAVLLNLAILKKKLKGTVDIDVLVGGSEGRNSRNIVLNHGFKYSEQPNSPLGRKWNNILKISRQYDYSHLMILGSDNLINEQTFLYYKKHSDESFISFNHLFIHDLQSSKTKLAISPNCIGAGFLIKRECVEKAQFVLWTEYKNKGLDGSMLKRIELLYSKTKIAYINPNANAVLVDIKSDTNIHSFTEIPGIKIPEGTMQQFDNRVISTLKNEK